MYPVLCKTIVNNKKVISDELKLAQTINNYFESVVGKLGINEYETSPDVVANSRSNDSVDVAIEKIQGPFKY